MGDYSTPDSAWLMNSRLVQDEEEAARIVRIIERVGDGGIIQPRDISSKLDDNEGILFNYAFAILMIYLYVNWKSISLPLLSLETIISDFLYSDAVWLGDNDIASRVAGIGETDDMLEHMSAEDRHALSEKYRELCRRHIEYLVSAGVLPASNMMVREIVKGELGADGAQI